MARTYEIRKNEVERKVIQYFQQNCLHNTILTISISKIAQTVQEKKDGVFRCIKNLQAKELLAISTNASKIKGYRWLGSHNLASSLLIKKETNVLEDIKNLLTLYKEKIHSLEEEISSLKKREAENDYEVISTQKLPGGIIVIYRKEERTGQKYMIDKNGTVLHSEEPYYPELEEA